jgi:Ca2+-binding EF-hand superfamily protein
LYALGARRDGISNDRLAADRCFDDRLSRHMTLRERQLQCFARRDDLVKRRAVKAAILLTGALICGASSTGTDANLESALLWFDSHDVDRDGKLTDAEIIRIVQKRFRRIDANQDGVLFLREYLDGIPSNRPDEVDRYTMRFAAMDVDHDDQVTVQEILDYTRKVMRDADLDRDGVTTRQEFIVFVKHGQK